MMTEERYTASNCSFLGVGYFMARPYLWLAPLFAALFSLFVLTMAFLFTAYASWPASTLTRFGYTRGIFKCSCHSPHRRLADLPAPRDIDLPLFLWSPGDDPVSSRDGTHRNDRRR